MSIQSEITRILTKRDESFEAVEGKGVTVPAGSTIDDLPDLIALIPTGGGGGMTVIETTDSHGGTIVTITGEEVKLQSKSVTPTTSIQLIEPDEGYTGIASVQVAAIPSQYIVPTGTTNITTNGTHDVSQYATASVSVSGGTVNIQTNKNATPTESAQTITPDTGYDALAQVTVGAISSTYIGSGITTRSSNDLTVSGATVTVPSGYYAANASKSVSAMTLPTTASTSASSGYTSKATINRSTSSQYINIPTGYNSAGAYYVISATPNGSVTAPNTISGTSATVSTGTNTLTLTKTVSVTPSVTSAGYISSGTAGNASVTLTASVTTKAAATITPTTSSQTIAAGTYLTGAQTIAAIPTQYKDVSGVTASASDVLSGKSFVNSSGSVNGTLVVTTVYTGSGSPSSSTGSNGDIYIQS